MPRSHHKGSYEIITNLRPVGPGRPHLTLKQLAAKLARQYARALAEQQANKLKKKLFQKGRKVAERLKIANRSHHKGYYKIVNGSDHDKGGIRRGPRRKRPIPKKRHGARVA